MTKIGQAWQNWFGIHPKEADGNYRQVWLWTGPGATMDLVWGHRCRYCWWLKSCTSTVVLKTDLLSSCQYWGLALILDCSAIGDTLWRNISGKMEYLKMYFLFKMRDLYWKEHGLMELGISPKRGRFLSSVHGGNPRMVWRWNNAPRI